MTINYKNLAKKSKKRGDILLLVAVVLLSIIGVIFIYSASNFSAHKTYGDSFFFVKKQIIGIVIGIIVMIVMGNFDYEKLKVFNVPVAIITVVSLLLVFVPGIGVENYGAKRNSSAAVHSSDSR